MSVLFSVSWGEIIIFITSTTSLTNEVLLSSVRGFIGFFMMWTVISFWYGFLCCLVAVFYSCLQPSNQSSQPGNIVLEISSKGIIWIFIFWFNTKPHWKHFSVCKNTVCRFIVFSYKGGGGGEIFFLNSIEL